MHLVSVIVLAAYEPTELDLESPHGLYIMARSINDDLLSSFSSKSGINVIKMAFGEDVKSEIDTQTNETFIIQDPYGKEIGALYWSKDDAIQGFRILLFRYSLFAGLIIALISVFYFYNLFKYKKMTNRIIWAEKSSNEKLSYKANYDELTGLGNRHLFLDRLNQVVQRSLRTRKPSAMLFLDLDGFKNINDTLGHECGDELLVLVGLKLQEIVRKQDTVSRFGGDEFCIILEDVGSGENADRVLSKIQDIFDSPFNIRGHQLYISASIGVVMIPDDGEDSISLLRFSDIAMYQAKRLGSNQYQFYSPELDIKAHRRAIIRNGLRKAIANNELSLKYQPIYDLSDQSLKYVEALLRWNSSESGFISPEDFIPIAEESGMIRDIGFWIIENSINDILEINSITNCTIRLSINISVNQLHDSDFLEKFLSFVDRANVDHSLIQLEITENLLIDDSIYQNDILSKLSDSGFKLVMDDFGTGYSSLSYINNIPLKTIKIDKSFVSILDQNENNGAMIKTIVYMAETYGLNTVAEGIETREQEEFLLSTGCQYGQGFLYCRPVSKEEIINKIEDKSFIVLEQNENRIDIRNSLD